MLPQKKSSARPLYAEPADSWNPESIDSLEDTICELKQSGHWAPLVDYIKNNVAENTQPNIDNSPDLIRSIIVEFQGDNPQLTIDALSYATGMNVYGNRTLRDYAKRNGISHEGFRKRVKEICSHFQLTYPKF